MKKGLFILLSFFIIVTITYNIVPVANAGFFEWFSKTKWFLWFNHDANNKVLIENRDRYSPEDFVLLVSKVGTGTLISDDERIKCDDNKTATCGTYTYSSGSEIILIATPESNYIFSKWNGCDNVSGAKCKIIINKSKKVIARFEPKEKSILNKREKNNLNKTPENQSVTPTEPLEIKNTVTSTYQPDEIKPESNQQHQVAQLPQQTAANTTNGSKIAIDSCLEMTVSGSYYLTQNIKSNNGTCLYIHDASDIHIDCKNYIIQGEKYKSATKYSTESKGDHAIFLKNVNNFSISSCNLETSGYIPLEIDNSKNGDIKNNNIGKFYARSDSSSNLNFENNKFSWYEQSYSNNVVMRNNTFYPEIDKNLGINVIPSIIISNFGSGNQFINNEIDGRAEGIFEKQEYADDGIVLEDENNDLIQGNNIRNVWDCGIETEGIVSNTKITGNSIKNAGICGIGGWYHNSLKDTTIKENVVQDTPLLFSFYRVYGLRPAGWDKKKIMPADDNVYFSNNYFIGNKLIEPRVSSGKWSSEFKMILPAYLSGITSERYPNDAEMIVKNNYFQDNDFGTELKAPWFYPLSTATDLGGNKCGSTESKEGGEIINYPLSC